MKNFKTLFAVLAMTFCSLTVLASTVDDLVAISSDYVFIADDVTSNGTVGLTMNELYANNHILSAGWNGNSVSNAKGSIGFASGGSHLNSLRLKNAQNMIAFKVTAPCTITLYTYSDAQRGIRIHKGARANDADETYYLQQPVSTPVWSADLDEAGVYYLSSYNSDFFFAGFEVTFPDDPASLYTLGLTAAIEGTEIQSVGIRNSGCTHVTTSDLSTTYQTLNNRTLYHGSADAFTAPVAHRNMIFEANTLIKTQNGETDGAENHDAYMAFTLNIANDYSLALRSITSDLYVENKSGWYYEYVIEDANGTELYKSAVQTIANGQSGSGHNNTVSLRWDEDIQDLTGEVTVKLIWWINSGGTTLALKDFNVTAVLTDNGGATALDNTNTTIQTVKRIVNGQLLIERDGKTYTMQGQLIK